VKSLSEEKLQPEIRSEIKEIPAPEEKVVEKAEEQVPVAEAISEPKEVREDEKPVEI